MKVTTALICDFAQVRDGLLFVSSGGITRLHRETLPGPLGVHIAIVVTMDQVEMARPHEFRLIIMDQDGETVAEAGGGFQVHADGLNIGEKQQVPLAINLAMAAVSNYGPHSVNLYIDGNAAHETTLYVVDAPPRP